MKLAVPAHKFVFRGRVRRVVDGDTLDVEIDQGMNSRRVERIRLLGINCPEVRGDSRESGLSATGWVECWCMVRVQHGAKWPLVIQTEKGDAFGRYLANVWCAETGEHLNSEIINAGHGVAYDGR